MDPHTESSFATRGAEILELMTTPHEEHRLIVSDDASPGGLFAAVCAELAQTSDKVGDLEHDGDEENPSYMDLAVSFGWLALSLVTTVVHIQTDPDQVPPTQAKAVLLERLDQDASRWVEENQAPDLEPARLLRAVTSLTFGAAQAIAELNGALTPTHEDEEAMEERDDEQLADAIASSPLQAAAIAIVAVEACEEIHYEDEG